MSVLRKIRNCIVVLGSLSLPMVSYGAFHTGNDLKDWGDALLRINSGTGVQEDLLEANRLMGYVAAISEMLSIVTEIMPGQKMCISTVTLGHMIAVVDKHLRANLEVWNDPADVIVVSALRQAFPCPVNNL